MVCPGGWKKTGARDLGKGSKSLYDGGGGKGKVPYANSKPPYVLKLESGKRKKRGEKGRKGGGLKTLQDTAFFSQKVNSFWQKRRWKNSQEGSNDGSSGGNTRKEAPI